MKNIILFISLLIPVFSYAQKTKTKEITRVFAVSISEYVTYDKTNNPTDTSYTMYGSDGRYKQLVEIFVIKRGSLSQMYFFLDSLKSFLKSEEEGTSADIYGVHASVERTMGIKSITIWNPEKHGSGYSEVTTPQINKMMDAILYYCERNALRLKRPKHE